MAFLLCFERAEEKRLLITGWYNCLHGAEGRGAEGLLCRARQPLMVRISQSGWNQLAYFNTRHLHGYSV